jgi:hypothetical protein
MHRSLVLLFLAMGCSAIPGSGDVDSHTTEPDGIREAGGLDVLEVSMPDTLETETTADLIELDLTDEATPDTGQPCKPGEGCFLDECTENSTCQSGYCVDHMGEGVCTISCQEECPPGWLCQPLGSGPDLVFVCISQVTNLCRPCSISNDCKAPGGAEDVCLEYGEEGSFCGAACTGTEDCPWGFTCIDASTIDGVVVKQCVADAGVCPCTDKSISLGLWSPCSVTNEFGSCPGKRFCVEGGLAECNAATPVGEICNGLDDDCDEDVDEPSLVEGKLIELCDDDNSCTEDSCTGEAGCSHEALWGVECVDGNPCTVADHCESDVCTGSIVDCDDDNICTDDTCDETGGCVFTANAATCDDGDPCTVADQCNKEECTGFALDCECYSDADCAALEDGDVCNGTLVCNMEKVPHTCAVDIDTIVSCPQPDGPDAPCLAAACDPVEGTCALVAGPNEVPCNDMDACTINDVCSSGSCTGGIEANCNDGNPCTDDICQPDQGCVNTPNDGACNDGNPCTDADHCAGGFCVPETVTDCDDQNPCTKDSCTISGGCKHESFDAPCSDGNPCTLNDWCLNGACIAGKVADCDDANPCTADSCENGECFHLPVNELCDDGSKCTSGDHCEEGKCVYTDVVTCDDLSICTTDTCTPDGGCSYKLNTAPCEDNDVCTLGDHCHLGQCISSSTLGCDDSNPCTDDSCSIITGCIFLPNADTCDDGNVCTVDDLCTGGQCKAGVAKTCTDNNLCTDDNCIQGLGCVFTNNVLACDDGDACTDGETCSSGTCVGGLAITCDDNNICTNDSCNQQNGCVFDHNNATCDDGKVCTDGDQCGNGQCQPGPALVCDDNVGCTVDTCDGESGCKFTPDETLCKDDNECTHNICNAQSGCSNPNVDNNTPCGPEGWKCIDGVCKESSPCEGGWAYNGRCWYEGGVMSSGNCPTCTQICANHGGCHEPSLVTEGWDKSCALCKATACPNCGCQDGPGNIAAHEAAPMHNGSLCEYTDHPAYLPICGSNHCNSTVWGRRRLCACNETP